MRHDSGGCALVLVYRDGTRAEVLAHAHDGGEAYMGPLIRKAIQYAKVQYKSGDITQILMAEEEMSLLSSAKLLEYCRTLNVRHVYYVTAKWDVDETKKAYHAYVRHLGPGETLAAEHLPEFDAGFSRKNTTFQCIV